ncbi:MAG: hypothetical protein M1833_006730 [Piccolia ochrophora]|nr:MAG: hypothetical protein M1833_006730 [Piccolia ochrophora]
MTEHLDDWDKSDDRNLSLMEGRIPTFVKETKKSLTFIRNSLRILFRPRIPPGYRRIFWTCDCGEEMYGDFKEKSPGAADELAAYLESRSDGNSHGFPGPSTDPATTRTGSSQLPYPSSDVVASLGTNTPLPNNAQSNVLPSVQQSPSSKQSQQQEASRSQQNSQQTSSQQQSLQQTVAQTPSTQMNIYMPTSEPTVDRFFELCVNTGKHRQTLGEIEVTRVYQDGVFFGKIAEQYQGLRGHQAKSTSIGLWMAKRFKKLTGLTWRPLNLLEPVSVSFIKFVVDTAPFVGSCESPSIPPKREIDEGRYDYKPCPLNVEPPMPSHIFLHHLNSAANHPTSKWLQRMPKKLETGILSTANTDPDEVVVGWGVHIQEGPNWYVISLAILVGLLVSGVVAVACAIVLKDTQSGFGIGSYIAAVQMAWMTALFFKWSRE